MSVHDVARVSGGIVDMTYSELVSFAEQLGDKLGNHLSGDPSATHTVAECLVEWAQDQRRAEVRDIKFKSGSVGT